MVWSLNYKLIPLIQHIRILMKHDLTHHKLSYWSFQHPNSLSQSSTTIVTPNICFHWLLSLSLSPQPNVKLASYQLILQPAGELTLKRASSSKWLWVKGPRALSLSVLHPCPGPIFHQLLALFLHRTCHCSPLAKLVHGSALFPWTRSPLLSLLSRSSLDRNHQQSLCVIGGRLLLPLSHQMPPLWHWHVLAGIT